MRAGRAKRPREQQRAEEEKCMFLLSQMFSVPLNLQSGVKKTILRTANKKELALSAVVHIEIRELNGIAGEKSRKSEKEINSKRKNYKSKNSNKSTIRTIN